MSVSESFAVTSNKAAFDWNYAFEEIEVPPTSFLEMQVPPTSFLQKGQAWKHITVAILAQGTNRADAITQAFLLQRFEPH